MPFSDVCPRRLRTAPVACAAVAVLVRGVVSWQAYARNPLVSLPQLDAWYYVHWALDIAGGDLVGRGGLIHGQPLFLNPLYAYLLAPLALVFGEGLIPCVLAAQALLGGATAALTAAAAGRLFGRPAAWVAGLGVAFATALVHLDTHVAVSGLGAFMVAGAVWCSATAPRDPSRPGGAHGPVAMGAWLGLGALARPITPLALPFFVWLAARRAPAGRRRAVALTVVGVFLVPAGMSLARNRLVSGETVVYTAASGANLYLGNNPAARRYRTMSSGGRFRFNPREMHDDARRYMAGRVGPDASWSEISGVFTSDVVDEFLRAPVASLVFLAQKARWFASPREVPSSANLTIDRTFAPLLHLAFVPSWLLVALGLVGVAVQRRHTVALLGAGSLVLAHVAVLTLVFPLSHYRSPALPALAVFAGGAVAWGLTAWRAQRRGLVGCAAAGVVAVAAVGALPPQPTALLYNGWFTLFGCYREMGQEHFDEAERALERGQAVFDATWPDEPDLPVYWAGMGYLYRMRSDAALAAGDVPHMRTNIALAGGYYRRVRDTDPFDWRARLEVVEARRVLGHPDEALAELEAAVANDPSLARNPFVLSRYVEVFHDLGDHERQRDVYRELLQYPEVEPGDRPRPWAVPEEFRRR